MKDPHQIAAEATREVRNYFGKPSPAEYGNDKVLTIIQDAIEKAQREAKREQHELDWAAFRKLWERRFKGKAYEQAVKDAVSAVEACAFGRVEQREKRK